MIDVFSGAGALVEERPLPSAKACLNKLACSLSIIAGSSIPLLEVLELQPEIMMDVTPRIHNRFFITYSIVRCLIVKLYTGISNILPLVQEIC